MKYAQVPEGEVKNKIAKDYFDGFDATKELGKIDFCVALPARIHTQEELASQYVFETQSLLWAEAKKGNADFYSSIVQLILTIGKARTFDKYLPPAFLGAFDAEKIAFIPYNELHEILGQNDFNWNITPSDHKTKEFKQVYDQVKNTIDTHSLLFTFGQDDKEIHEFVQMNFIAGKVGLSKIRIDKNNFIVIYNKWLTAVKPTIGVDWGIAKKNGIIDADFYLADLLSLENETLKDKLFVLLKKNEYELDRKIDDMGMFTQRKASFLDNQEAHHRFWNKYERPPKEEYWDYIVGRRDLLVPQDIRERKGSFFTPQIWVELSQKYLADVLGENWQDEYYIWDCAAGTGNLLAGLTNKFNIWASTLDRQDVDVMHDRIKNGANLLEKHVFQFDFLNDDFSKLPKSLQDVINSPEKRKQLVVYINPPYAEATDGIGQGGKKLDVSKETKIYTKYGNILKKAKNELFAQFLVRIYKEIPDAKIAQFSKLKTLQSSNFLDFRKFFEAKLEKIFIVPADTFDNVIGQFPIGFMIWDTQQKTVFKDALADVYNHKGVFIGNKNIHSYSEDRYINDWIKQYLNHENSFIGLLAYLGNDFQNTNQVRFCITKPTSHLSTISLNRKNIIPASIYIAVRHCIEATWLNDRDQFLFPHAGWETDTTFQNDCLAYALFHGQNRISANEGTNHWIPFTEQEVDASEKFDSNFMAHFIAGKLKGDTSSEMFGKGKAAPTKPLVFSQEAQAVFEAGKALWRYYHVAAQKVGDVNASLYDIRTYFQGRNTSGKMNNKSKDETYTVLIGTLREKLKELANKITPKVYQYGFLKA